MLRSNPSKLHAEVRRTSQPDVKVIQIVSFLNPPRKALRVEDKLKRVKVASLAFSLDSKLQQALAAGKQPGNTEMHKERNRFLNEAS